MHAQNETLLCHLATWKDWYRGLSYLPARKMAISAGHAWLSDGYQCRLCMAICAGHGGKLRHNLQFCLYWGVPHSPHLVCLSGLWCLVSSSITPDLFFLRVVRTENLYMRMQRRVGIQSRIQTLLQCNQPQVFEDHGGRDPKVIGVHSCCLLEQAARQRRGAHSWDAKGCLRLFLQLLSQHPPSDQQKFKKEAS